MAHFAELDNDNVVIRVVTVDNNVLFNREVGQEEEQLGVDFLNNLYGESVWKQCSFNGSIRKHYPGQGAVYHEDIDAFIHPPRYPSWTVLNTETFLYEPEVGMPDYILGYNYLWNEEQKDWDVTNVAQIIADLNPDFNVSVLNDLAAIASKP